MVNKLRNEFYRLPRNALRREIQGTSGTTISAMNKTLDIMFRIMENI